MSRTPIESMPQTELLWRLRAAIDTARKYPSQQHIDKAIKLANDHPRALRSSHLSHNLGKARVDWLADHEVQVASWEPGGGAEGSVPKRLSATAYHEAGHVVAAHHQGRATRRVTIVPEGDTLGSCAHYRLREKESFAWDTSYRNRIRIERLIISSLGGCAAEARFLGRTNLTGAHDDWHTAANLSTYQAGSDEEADAYLNWLWVRTRNIFRLDHWWDMTSALADALVEHRTLSATEVKKLMRF